MGLIGILFAFFYAVVLTGIFSLIFRSTGPWSGFWVFFFLLFFIALSAGEWAAPVGPAAWGYYWAPGLFAAIIFALLLAAATPTSRSGRSSRRINKKNTEREIASNYSAEAPKGEKIYEGDEDEEATIVIGLFFWILMIILIIVAIAGIIV